MNILKTLFKHLTGQQFTLYMDGGGGGGGGSSTGTQTQISELPEWARGYAKNTLEKGAALSDKPYQTYGQDRIAGFSPMQQQAQQDAANMQTNQGTGAGMGIAGLAALGGLNQDYNGIQARTQNFGMGAADRYMSPYAMQALQPTLNEQARQSQIQGNQLAAKAVGQGAFGGSRQGLEQAENARNLGILQGNTISQGMNTAYNNAMNQFNADQARQLQAQQANIGQQQFGANLGLQGLNTALQGAGQLGALGQQQFQQGMDINKLQSAYGGQQQALQQQGLTQAYQDFQNQQNYPYKQLGFMSDLIRGLPLGQQTTKTMYEPDPSMAQQIGSIGLGAYGLSKFMAEGGMAYADGGSVENTGNIERIVSKLSDQQLQQSAQAAKARGDIDQLDVIQSEMAMRASERNGIAGGVTPEMADRMAGGGVVAFASGGLNEYMKTLSDLGQQDISATPEERLQGIKSALPGIQEMYGPSATAPYMEEIKGERAKLGKMSDEGEGLGALAASQALLRPGSKSRALAGAMGAFGQEVVKMKKEQRDADRALRQSEITLATADQARADGQIGKAQDLYKQGQDDKKDALNRKIGVAEKQAQIEGGLEQARVGASATLGRQTDLDKLTKVNYEAMLEAGKPANKATLAAAANAATDQLGKFPGSARAEAAGAKAIAPEVESALMQSKPYRKAMQEQRYEDAAAIRAQIVGAIKPADNKGGPAPVQQAPVQPTIKPGQVMDGYRFKGGDPADKSNWAKV
jgi:hypothetical protein